ncbi:MAG TPA: zinc-binding dehydrogenase [Caulobacteraceae bacterium]|nr:zinc-binding dehydrogenase [Caulobacteraceae bacterium]
MKRIRIAGDGRARVEEVAIPEPADGEVLVKVMASGISGGERAVFFGERPDAWAGRRVNGGHEAAGEIVDANATDLAVGDRVALYGGYRRCGRCRHCLSGRWLYCADDPRPPQAAGYHSQYVTVRADFCLPLPDGVSFAAGAMIGAPFGAVLRAFRRARLGPRERVFVVGAGPLGLAAITLARWFGCEVIASDPVAWRRAFALDSGAAIAIDPFAGDVGTSIRSMIGSEGVDLALDCSGTELGRAACLDAIARGGRIAYIGAGAGLELSPEQAGQIITKEAAVFGVWYADPAEMLTLADQVAAGFDPTRILSHRFPIEAADAAFERAFGGEAGKVLIEPWR